jgi:hypothetical protein
MTYSCTYCQSPILETNEAQRYRHKQTGRIFCLKRCGYRWRQEHRAPRQAKARPTVPCTVCGGPADLSGHRQAQHAKTGRAYCSRQCSDSYRASVSSKTMAATNRNHAAGRMKARNPMADPETRQKMAATLRSIGHRPAQRGGNGKPPPLPEVVLAELLRAFGFQPQCAVPTGAKRGSGLPPSYKVDVGNPALRIAVEADGPSHSGHRKDLDRKRDACLRGLGWIVLRFSNAEILATPWTVLSTTLKSMGCTHTLQAG